MKYPQFTPEVNAWYVERLKEAVAHFCGGSADEFARKIGWPTGGGMIRQIRLGKRPMQRSVLARINGSDDPLLIEWFSLPPHLQNQGADLAVTEDDVLSNELLIALRGMSPEMQLVAENQLRALAGLPPITPRSRKQTGT